MAVIEIINDDGYVLIDDTRYNHRLLSAGAKAVEAIYELGMNRTIDVFAPIPSAADGFPVLFFTPPVGVWMSLWQIRPGSNGQIRWTYMSTAEAGQAHDYYLFQDGLSEPIAASGMVTMWDAAGNVTFDSDCKYASIVDFVQIGPGETLSKTYKAGRKYAVSNLTPLVFRSSGGPGGGWLGVQPLGFKVNGSTVTFARYVYRDGAAASNNGEATVATFMVIDVTAI